LQPESKIHGLYRREVDVVDTRTIEAILDEWRERERQLEAHPVADTEGLQAQIAALRDEHIRALAARKNEADELRRLAP
jgi:hypothetical protein